MRRDPKAYLFDIQRASDLLDQFTRGKEFHDYECSPLLRSAIERQFEIIGEALNQLAVRHPDVTKQISEHRKIIAFRNILIHGYAKVDNKIVWDVVYNKLPILRREVQALLNKYQDKS